MTSKKIILISSAFILAILFTIFGCRIFFRQNNCKIPVARECPKVKNLETKAIEENLDAEPTKEWKTYYDERYKYSLNFPSGSNMVNVYEHTEGEFVTANGGVSFYPEDLPLGTTAAGMLENSKLQLGTITVEILENSKFHSFDEWLESETNEYMSRVVEKKINIDGNEAIVTHQAGMLDGKISQEYKQQKTAVFIKDSKLFIITTNMDYRENEKIWNSFKFVTDDYPMY